MDVAKEFDRAEDDVLLELLWIAIVRGLIHYWFASYCSERSMGDGKVPNLT